jgi:hypothetical protein
MVHVEEAEEIQNLIKAIAIPLNIICARRILRDHRANDGEESKQDE